MAHWKPFVHVRGPLDLAGPRADGRLVMAAAGRLWLLDRGGSLRRFAPAYQSPGGEEPYIALASPLAGEANCFGQGAVYALRLGPHHGILRIDARGGVRSFATLTARGLEDGITFDQVGGFGRRLLVTINAGSRTTVDAIDCRGRVHTVTRHAPRVEGGIVVAPRQFGRFGGDLIAPDETGGRVFAVTPRGKTELVANSRLPHGGDIGVESLAFLPDNAKSSMLLADRLTPGNRHPGDDVVLGISDAALYKAGARPFDLLAATEGGARTDALRCTRAGARCQVRHVADGPAIAHGEGHIASLG
jgi:hypothetical protein